MNKDMKNGPRNVKNLIIHWDNPKISIKREYKYLGEIKMEPKEYQLTHGDNLIMTKDLPDIAVDFETEEGFVLAADYQKETFSHELEGDVHALKLIDLKSEGLSQYISYLKDFRSRTNLDQLITEQAIELDRNMPSEFLA